MVLGPDWYAAADSAVKGILAQFLGKTVMGLQLPGVINNARPLTQEEMNTIEGNLDAFLKKDADDQDRANIKEVVDALMQGQFFFDQSSPHDMRIALSQGPEIIINLDSQLRKMQEAGLTASGLSVDMIKQNLLDLKAKQHPLSFTESFGKFVIATLVGTAFVKVMQEREFSLEDAAIFLPLVEKASLFWLDITDKNLFKNAMAFANQEDRQDQQSFCPPCVIL